MKPARTRLRTRNIGVRIRPHNDPDGSSTQNDQVCIQRLKGEADPPHSLGKLFFTPFIAAGLGCGTGLQSTATLFINEEFVELPITSGEPASTLVQRLGDELVARGYESEYSVLDLNIEIVKMPDSSPVVTLGWSTEDTQIMRHNPTVSFISILAVDIPLVSPWSLALLALLITLSSIFIMQNQRLKRTAGAGD